MFRWWAWPSELRRRGILGINRRNLGLLFELNPRGLYRQLDDKVITKRLCAAGGVPVPETYAVVERYGDIRPLSDTIGRWGEFVVKPARGSGGRGVLVVAGQCSRGFRTVRGMAISLAELRYHLSTTLAGLYSLGGRPDRAIIEERVNIHPSFRALAVDGTPDVRVIIHQRRPAMAMLRLPTTASMGRANLHQGAVGVGIDIATGRTRGGVCLNRAVSIHPDTGASVQGIEIPGWPDVLATATRLSEALGLGYLGVDIVLDAGRGPVVLEANARPGLAIQIANQCGLAIETENPVAPVRAVGRQSLRMVPGWR